METALIHLKQADPILRAIIDRVGPYAMTYREPSFESLARAIVFQQLNGKAARSIHDKLVAKAGGKLTPQSVLRLAPSQMRSAGVSPQKAGYLRDLAKRTQSGEIDFARLAQLSDQEVIERLTRVKGIGIWTAQMFLIFALQRGDVLPVGDYGVRAAIRKAYRKRSLPSPRQIEKLARAWRPHCSVACWYLWRSLDTAL